jgi:hypothetical protein
MSYNYNFISFCLSYVSNLQTIKVGWFGVINAFVFFNCHMGGANHIGSTQMAKLKIKLDFVGKI